MTCAVRESQIKGLTVAVFSANRLNLKGTLPTQQRGAERGKPRVGAPLFEPRSLFDLFRTWASNNPRIGRTIGLFEDNQGQEIGNNDWWQERT
jgi:hypothetical protein